MNKIGIIAARFHIHRNKRAALDQRRGGLLDQSGLADLVERIIDDGLERKRLK
ncbi:hypothetical protein [Chloroflexus sp.]|uniref:hypothetical protein n=1 Tax=Chloroflexus sp. TaxID=1904827 RepID=UPI002ACE5B45|nr:hypothetical protein [Chloroflexus sp.]